VLVHRRGQATFPDQELIKVEF